MTLPQAGEVTEQGPAWLPPAYFLATLAWLGAAAVGLMSIAPDLARGLVYQPRVFAVTHVVTLGVITSAIFGALHQFIPAVLGVAPRHPKAGMAGFWLFQVGLILLISAFWSWNPERQALAWVLVFLGVGAASWNTLPARRRATRNRHIGTYVSLGHSALGMAMLLAAVRIGDGLGWWHTSRDGLILSHFHLGALGLGTLTAIGFGSKMLPAFLGTSQPRTGPLAWIGAVVSSGLVLFSIGAVWGVTAPLLAGGFLMLLGAAAHLALIGSYFTGRTRPLDPGLGFVLAASACYLVALIAGALLLLLRPRPGAVWAAYAMLVLLGWLTLFIIGVMHRVVPRILTLIRVRRRRRLTPVHQRVELISTPLAWLTLALMASGISGLAVFAGLGLPRWATAASLTFLAGVLCLVVQGARVARVTWV